MLRRVFKHRHPVLRLVSIIPALLLLRSSQYGDLSRRRPMMHDVRSERKGASAYMGQDHDDAPHNVVSADKHYRLRRWR